MTDDSDRTTSHCAHVYASESIRCTRCGEPDLSRITHGRNNVKLGEAVTESADVDKR